MPAFDANGSFLRGRATAASLGLLLLGACGCAGPLSRPLASFQENREIDRLANDSSIPLATEVGLASSAVSADDDDR